MNEKRETGFDDLFGEDEVRGILAGEFYGKVSTEAGHEHEATESARKRPRAAKSGTQRKRKKKKADDSHYGVICISLYNDDLARLDEKVTALKASGHRKMSRSALIRYALDTVDLSKLPRAY